MTLTTQEQLYKTMLVSARNPDYILGLGRIDSGKETWVPNVELEPGYPGSTPS